MPQMSPLSWFNLFFFFTSIMLMIMWMIFFKNNKNPHKKLIKNKSMKKWNIKWY